MDIVEAAKNVSYIRSALSTIALLELTSFLYPVAENVANCSKYDFIVAGGGTAGCIIASRLSEDPNVSVLLIEAGGDPPIESNIPALQSYAIKSRVDWQHKSEVDKQGFQCLQENRFRMSHGKALGGSSCINNMFYARGNPNDFDTWALITGDQSWNYTNVLPYFKKSERLQDNGVLRSRNAPFHGTCGKMGVTKLHYQEAIRYLSAVEEVGYASVLDTNGATPIGFSPQMVALSNGLRQSTANAFLSNIGKRNNLHVMKDSLVTKVLFDKNKNAIGVIAIDANKQNVTIYAKKEVIVSAGPLNSPQILKLSGVGPKHELDKLKIDVIADLPVGEKLQTHFQIVLVAKQFTNNFKPPRNPHDYPFPIVTGYVALNSSQKIPDYQSIAAFVNGKTILSLCSEQFSFINDICQHFYNETKHNDAVFFLVTNFDRKSRGRVSLRNTNPEDSPIFDMYPFDSVDVENYINYVEDIARLFNTTAYNEVGAEIVELPKCQGLEGRDYWRCYLKCMGCTSFHYAGTTPMGSVVDSKLRVLGVKKLRVADCGVMPAITSGNTMAATIMIAEKAADMIKQDNCGKFKV